MNWAGLGMGGKGKFLSRGWGARGRERGPLHYPIVGSVNICSAHTPRPLNSSIFKTLKTNA